MGREGKGRRKSAEEESERECGGWWATTTTINQPHPMLKFKHCLLAAAILFTIACVTCQAATPLGSFVMRTSITLGDGEKTGLLRACANGVCLSTASTQETTVSSDVWKIVHPLSGEEGSVSIFSQAFPQSYLAETKAAMGQGRVLQIVTLSDKNVSMAQRRALSFKVTSGLSDFRRFSFRSTNGGFIAAIPNMTSACNHRLPHSIGVGTTMSMPEGKAQRESSSWTLEVPVKREVPTVGRLQAVPLGTFLLQPLSSLANPTYASVCENDMYAVSTTQASPNFRWNFLKALNGKVGYISIRSEASAEGFLLAGEDGTLRVGQNVSDVDRASFHVVGGLSDPEMFSFVAMDGSFIALTGNLSGACSSRFQAPESDIGLHPAKIHDKDHATWRLLAA